MACGPGAVALGERLGVPMGRPEDTPAARGWPSLGFHPCLELLGPVSAHDAVLTPPCMRRDVS